MADTFGQHLIKGVLPAEAHTTTPYTKGSLTKKLTDLARRDPKQYVATVMNVKKLGDMLATFEGASIGLADITPDYAERNEIIEEARRALAATREPAKIEAILVGTQKKIVALSERHTGSMATLARSGSRGNMVQLSQSVAAPVVAMNSKGGVSSWLLDKSYSEGLTPADYWVAADAARLATVQSRLAVSEPGDVSKILINTMYPLVVTQADCGTHNGISMKTSDSHILGRYRASDGALVTPALLASVKTPQLVVRSPMTCHATQGVCAKCQGVDEKGKQHAVGINVGVRAAQAMAEPLTQMALNIRHGGRSAAASGGVTGLQAFRQFTEVPESFIGKATLAELAGKVTKITPAAHGGFYVFIENVEHYVSPNLKLKVNVGDKVEAGDVLSEGVPKLNEVVQHKGVGAGRQYMVDALHGIYRDQGIELDKRHVELLSRVALAHVRVADHSDEHPELLKGDVIPYSTYRDLAAKNTKEMNVDAAVGQVLGEEVLHFTAGTPITASIVSTLKTHSVKTVKVATNVPHVEFMMKPLTRVPLLNPDWLARMSHRFLKDSLVRGAHFGDTSDLHGVHPVPAYAAGSEFGEGTGGKY